MCISRCYWQRLAADFVVVEGRADSAKAGGPRWSRQPRFCGRDGQQIWSQGDATPKHKVGLANLGGGLRSSGMWHRARCLHLCDISLPIPRCKLAARRGFRPAAMIRGLGMRVSADSPTWSHWDQQVRNAQPPAENAQGESVLSMREFHMAEMRQ